MTLDEFFESDWQIMGIRTDKVQLGRSSPSPKLIWVKLDAFITLAQKLHLQYEESADESEHLWVDLESIMTLLHKLHLQYEDNDLTMLLEHDGKDS